MEEFKLKVHSEAIAAMQALSDPHSAKSASKNAQADITAILRVKNQELMA